MARLLLGLILWCLVAAAIAGGGTTDLAGETDVAVDYRDGLYSGHLRMRVPVRPEAALAVLTDFDHMADFVPNLTTSRVVQRAGNVYRVAQEGKAEFGPFTFRFTSERRIEVFPEGRVVSRVLSGSFRPMHSELRLQPAGPEETRIDYRIEMAPAIWMPSAIGTNFLRHELAEQFAAMAREMVRRERSAAP